MIIVCEPQCAGFSHEKVNSAFLYGLSLAYPHEDIIFYAEHGHIECVIDCLRLSEVTLSNVEYRELRIPKSDNSISSLIEYYFILNKVLEPTTRAGANKFIFLSINSDSLYVIKYLIKNKYQSIRCAMVLHGVAESLKHRTNLLDRILFIKHFFHFRNALTYAESDNVKYLTLSPYITSNLIRFTRMNEGKFVNFHMPYLFSRNYIVSQNPHLILGILGKGYTSKLRELALQLNRISEVGKYEIKVISNNTCGLENIPNINCVSPGKRLSRQEIDFHVRDVDYVLFLYDANSYELSASGALFDAISYEKPIVYLNNNFIQFYDRLAGGMGIRCSDLDQMKSLIAEIIRNYHDRSRYLVMVHNTQVLKETINIKYHTNEFFEIFNNLQLSQC